MGGAVHRYRAGSRGLLFNCVHYWLWSGTNSSLTQCHVKTTHTHPHTTDTTHTTHTTAGCDAPRLCSLQHLDRYDQKDSCSDMNKAGYAACDAPRAVSSLVRRLMMLGITAVSDQKDYCTFCWQWHVQGLFCWPLHLAMCSLACLAGPDARHLGRYEPERLIRVLHCCSHARCVQRHALGYGVQKTAVSPQLQPIFKVVDLPVVPQRLIPMIKRDSPFAVHTVVHVPVYRSCRFPSWRRGILPCSRLFVGP